MNKPGKTDKDTSRQALLQSLRIVAGIAFLFVLVTGILLMINYWRLRESDPMSRELLEAMVLRLQEYSGDETLKGEIRELDLLARKAYFSSQWQLRTGSLLFVGGSVTFMVCVFLINRLGQSPGLPDPASKKSAGDQWTIQSQQRRILIFGGLFVLLLGMVSVVVPYFDLAFDSEVSQNLSFNSTADEVVENLPEEVEPVDPATLWPAFRGPGGNAIAPVEEAPTWWDVNSGKGIKWQTPVPLPGYNSPVVWGDKIFLSGADEQSQEIYCFNRRDGRLLWKHNLDPVAGEEKLDDVYPDTGRAASTLAVDGRYVCAIFPNGNLICTNFSGQKIWALSLGVPQNHYGHASSLIIHDGLVFVQWDQGENPRLLAYNLADGSLAWQVERYAISWSSPICVNTGSDWELILTDSESVTSYEPRTGRLNWKKGDLSGGEMGPSPFFHNGVVYAATDMALAAAIKLNQNSEPEILWEFDEHLPDTASMVGTDTLLFMATSYSVLTCIDAVTGKMLWEEETDDGFYCSPILVGDLVYVWDMEGVAHVFSVDRTYRQLAKIPTGERVVSTPAFVNGNIIIRGEKYLYCIESDRASEKGGQGG